MTFRRYFPLALAIVIIFLFIFVTPTDHQFYEQNNKSTSLTKETNDLPHLIQPTFKDFTFESGLTIVHQQGTIPLSGIDEIMGSGACIIDYNNDGWPDIFVVNGSGQTRFYGKKHWWIQPKGSVLYRNLQNGKFLDVTKESGLTQRTWGMGCFTADLDNDGYQDLLITNIGKNTLYKNNGNGKFIDITDNSGLSGEKWSTSASFADFDNDGLLDIYISNYIRYKKDAYTFETNKGFNNTKSSYFDATLFDSEPNQLYRNTGNFQFKEVSQAAGVANKEGRSLSAIWFDINADQFPDLYVTNDQRSHDKLYLNQGNGHFKEADQFYRVNSPKTSRSISVGDIDQDADLDFFISSKIGISPTLLINKQTPKSFLQTPRNKKNQLFDIARELGIATERTQSFSSWGSGFHDFNNDGWLDLFVTNGLQTLQPDSPGLTTGQKDMLWLNPGNAPFKQVLNFNEKQFPQSTRGVVFSDLDNDGDIDIYVTHNNDLGQLLRNDLKSNHHWLGMILEATNGNRDAIGAKVWLTTNAGTQYREVGTNQSYLSQSDRRLHFGIGPTDTISKIKVLWPDGTSQTYTDCPVDIHVKLKQQQKEIIQLPLTPKKSITPPANKIKLATHLQHYFEWITTYDPDNLYQKLKIVLSDPDPKIRFEGIQYLNQYKNEKNIPLLINSLKDSNTRNRVATINVLKEYEDEHSIRWMLPLLKDHDPKVQCATAQAFALFFREEEAVINHKYLALSPLITMLKSPHPEVRQCSAIALGDAERFRAVMPLVELLKDPVDNVQLAAIRSLGLIREKQSIPYLLPLFQDHSTSAKVRAKLLITLKRLNYENLDTILLDPLTNFSHQKSHSINVANILKTYNAIIDDQVDGIVINHDRLIKVTIDWIEKTLNQATSKNKFLPELHLVLDLLENKQNKSIISVLDRLIQHPVPSIRATAYHLLVLLLPKEKAIDSAKSGIIDSNETVKIAIMKGLNLKSIKFPSRLLNANLTTSEAKLAAIPLFKLTQDKAAIKALHRIANDPNEAIEIRLSAIKALIKISGANTPLNKNLFNHSNQKLKSLALSYWAKNLPKYPMIQQIPKTIAQFINDQNEIIQIELINILITRNELWAKKTLKDILFNRNNSNTIRQHLIKQLGNLKNSKYANDLLFSLAKVRHDPLSLNAIRVLKITHEKKIKQFLWKILTNPKESESAHFAAAQSLAIEQPNKVTNHLNALY